MGSKKLARILDEDAIRIILIILGSVFSALVLTFSVFAIQSLIEENLGNASRYLLGIFIVLGLSRLVTFLRERTKVSFLRFLLLLVLDVALGIIILFARYNTYLYSLCGGLYCFTIIISRIFKIIQRHTIRSCILNGAIILFALLLSLGLFIPSESDTASTTVLIICLVVAISSLIEVLSNATSNMKIKILFKIMLRTFALEVILGLFTIIIAASLVFYLYEPTINSFGDGLWYSFAVVTTIGFGDFFATNIVTRIVTVFLGLYGILVVAIITSIIVNFYNETAGKKDTEELKEIKKEEISNKKK